jgi:hypothetical protein
MSEWFKPDPDFWKKLSYHTLWKRHWEKVEKLKDKLIERFPSLENSMKFGLGAVTDKWLKIPPDQKGEPDIFVYHEYQLLCCIEVSGSDKVRMPNDIWIRPDKLTHAKEHEEESWFYMEYPNQTRVLTREIVERNKNNIKTVRIKWDKTRKRKVSEDYIAVPYRESFDEEEMFDWIAERIA